MSWGRRQIAKELTQVHRASETIHRWNSASKVWGKFPFLSPVQQAFLCVEAHEYTWDWLCTMIMRLTKETGELCGISTIRESGDSLKDFASFPVACPYQKDLQLWLKINLHPFTWQFGLSLWNSNQTSWLFW